MSTSTKLMGNTTCELSGLHLNRQTYELFLRMHGYFEDELSRVPPTSIVRGSGYGGILLLRRRTAEEWQEATRLGDQVHGVGVTPVWTSTREFWSSTHKESLELSLWEDLMDQHRIDRQPQGICVMQKLTFQYVIRQHNLSARGRLCFTHWLKVR